MGGPVSVRPSYRLFMAPGMDHCGGGDGPNTFDSIQAIKEWVEAGKAPEQIVAMRIRDGKTERTRPLCPYPQVATYKGTGSTDDDANFSCSAPKWKHLDNQHALGVRANLEAPDEGSPSGGLAYNAGRETPIHDAPVVCPVRRAGRAQPRSHSGRSGGHHLSAHHRGSRRGPGALHILSERIWEPHPGAGLPHSSVLQRGRLSCPAEQVRAEAAAAR